MIHYNIQNLENIRSLLSLLSDEHYRHKSETLSGASVGQHVRHILEFYTCLIQGLNIGRINYDSRQRDLVLESQTEAATDAIDMIVEYLSSLPKDSRLILEGNYSHEEGAFTNMVSSLYRELAFNLEHSIHHQALIKVGLKELSLIHLIDPHFGIAPATIRFNQTTSTPVKDQ